jgi:pentose-5-phosphate-3-epimerase
LNKFAILGHLGVCRGIGKGALQGKLTQMPSAHIDVTDGNYPKCPKPRQLTQMPSAHIDVTDGNYPKCPKTLES